MEFDLLSGIFGLDAEIMAVLREVILMILV